MREECRDSSGPCDYCKQEAPERVWTRDYDEGMSGPVYHICRACYQRQEDRINEELRYQEEHYGYGLEDDYDDCPNCGGDDVVYMCLDEIGCVDPEGGCDLCERRCDWCRPTKAEGRR